MAKPIPNGGKAASGLLPTWLAKWIDINAKNSIYPKCFKRYSLIGREKVNLSAGKRNQEESERVTCL